jgi:hypothetical protein
MKFHGSEPRRPEKPRTMPSQFRSYITNFAGASIGFGLGFVIGAWLNHAFDWGGHRVF